MNKKEVELSTVLATVLFLSITFLWCCIHRTPARTANDSNV